VPWPVYSTRFVTPATFGVWQYYTVPAGMRAVVKCVLAVGAGTGGGDYWTSVGGAYGPVGSFPGSLETKVHMTTLVAYQHETIGAMRSTDQVGLTVHGYLFKEASLLLGREPETEPGDPPVWHLAAGDQAENKPGHTYEQAPVANRGRSHDGARFPRGHFADPAGVGSGFYPPEWRVLRITDK